MPTSASDAKTRNATIRICLVEDDARVRSLIADWLNQEPELTVVNTYPDAESAIPAIPADKPDVVLMDINLPGMRGTECVTHIRARFPEIQVMMLTVFEDSDDIFASLEAGATGYMLKKTPPARLMEAIADLVNGGSPMSSEIARKVVTAFARPVPKTVLPSDTLTPREEEILRYLSKGYLYKEIADQLFISIDTVRSHIRKIYQKLHVRSRAEAMLSRMRP